MSVLTEAVAQYDREHYAEQRERVMAQRIAEATDYATQRVNAYLGHKTVTPYEWSWRQLATLPVYDLRLWLRIVEREYELVVSVTEEQAAVAPDWWSVVKLLVDQMIDELHKAGIPGDRKAGMR